MASITVFDPDTNRSKFITAELQGTVIIQDLDAVVDYYIQLTTAAKKVSGSSIAPITIRDVTPTNVTTKIEEGVKSMVNYGGGANAMSFST